MRRGQDYAAITEFSPVTLQKGDTLDLDHAIHVNTEALGVPVTVYGIEWRLITSPVIPPARRKRSWRRLWR